MTNSHVAAVAALVGDPGRACMLTAMMDGRAHTAGELAAVAGVAAATASGHLAKLLDRQLVVVVATGRHRYYRLTSADVARMLEGIMVVAEMPKLRPRAIPGVPEELREARTCYDHIAGRLGVAIADTLTCGPELRVSNGECALTDHGRAHLTKLGIDLANIQHRSRRLLCRPCLDWSERRPHLAGALGTALLERLLSLGWIKRVERSRELRISAGGTTKLVRHFGYSRSARMGN
jgi:DNA-binding transcriptional ArsR family regulator